MRNFLRLCLGIPLAISVLTAVAAFLSGLIHPVVAWFKTGHLDLNGIYWIDGLKMTAVIVPLMSVVIAAVLLAVGLWRERKSLHWYSGLSAAEAKRFHDNSWA